MCRIGEIFAFRCRRCWFWYMEHGSIIYSYFRDEIRDCKRVNFNSINQTSSICQGNFRIFKGLSTYIDILILLINVCKNSIRIVLLSQWGPTSMIFWIDSNWLYPLDINKCKMLYISLLFCKHDRLKIMVMVNMELGESQGEEMSANNICYWSFCH